MVGTRVGKNVDSPHKNEGGLIEPLPTRLPSDV